MSNFDVILAATAKLLTIWGPAIVVWALIASIIAWRHREQ